MSERTKCAFCGLPLGVCSHPTEIAQPKDWQQRAFAAKCFERLKDQIIVRSPEEFSRFNDALKKNENRIAETLITYVTGILAAKEAAEQTAGQLKVELNRLIGLWENMSPPYQDCALSIKAALNKKAAQ